jgi:hypothetical protein
MKHSWSECDANAYNPNRPKDQGKPQNANKKPNTKANKFAAAAEKHADPSLDIEDKILRSSCFTAQTMVQLDNYLMSKSCSCEQIELDTKACESFNMTLKECFASGECHYEVHPFST